MPSCASVFFTGRCDCSTNRLDHCPRTMYGWPLGKSFFWGPAFWSVAAMYTASRLRHDLPRALMKSAGWEGPDQWLAVCAAPVRTGCPFRPVSPDMPSPHVAPHQFVAAERVRLRSASFSAWHGSEAAAAGDERPDSAGHSGGQRDSDDLHRFSCEHSVQPVGR